MAAHLARVNVLVQVGVGAAFDFHPGHVKRSPVWMQKTGLEWVYRMLQDRRLIKRYLMTNPVFLALFLRDFINAKIRNFST
ncbi:WecB/TagA/CpsF family glycosyltransferase [Methylicorpusculum oleiharenae]|uniref:WecB/TagA/CpsF family glycosyltransferase n=1 Tax=Methylicorpusculum oleiharenae TaxID=1338687 RepID=UPI0038B31DD0